MLSGLTLLGWSLECCTGLRLRLYTDNVRWNVVLAPCQFGDTRDHDKDRIQYRFDLRWELKITGVPLDYN